MKYPSLTTMVNHNCVVEHSYITSPVGEASAVCVNDLNTPIDDDSIWYGKHRNVTFTICLMDVQK